MVGEAAFAESAVFFVVFERVIAIFADEFPTEFGEISGGVEGHADLFFEGYGYVSAVPAKLVDIALIIVRAGLILPCIFGADCHSIIFLTVGTDVAVSVTDTGLVFLQTLTLLKLVTELRTTLRRVLTVSPRQ